MCLEGKGFCTWYAKAFGRKKGKGNCRGRGAGNAEAFRDYGCCEGIAQRCF